MLYRARFLTLVAIIAVIAACSSGSRINNVLDSRQNIGLCPLAGSVYDSARIVELDGDSMTYDNITYTGDIAGVRLACRYAGDDPIQASLEIDFAFGKGQRGLAEAHNYTYWVAVTRPSGKVLNKAYFTIKADFSNGPITSVSETIEPIIIPRANDTVSGANFEVLVGFRLTPEQLQFNREGRRFLLDAGYQATG